jgi:hypothetical protein
VYVAALRKLALRHKGISMKYHEGSAVKKHTDHRSELYGPQMHFGEHPKHRLEVTNVCSRFLTGIKGANISVTSVTIKEVQRSIFFLHQI